MLWNQHPSGPVAGGVGVIVLCSVVQVPPHHALSVSSFPADSPKDVSIGQEPRGKILEGVRVRLNCNVGLANPKELTYVWYKDDLQLSSTDAMWTISKAVPEDSGTYFCEARNTVGKSESSTVTLDVLCE